MCEEYEFLTHKFPYSPTHRGNTLLKFDGRADTIFRIMYTSHDQLRRVIGSNLFKN